MILVLLGTQKNSFKRLLEEIDKCIKNNIITERVIVQAGYTQFISEDMEIFDFISKDKLDKLILESSFIISHGGVGSIIGCIKKTKKVIGVPRLKKYGEHVNNHQTQIVQTLGTEGYIIPLFEMNKLNEAIKKTISFIPKKFISTSDNIIKLISDYIEKN